MTTTGTSRGGATPARWTTSQIAAAFVLLGLTTAVAAQDLVVDSSGQTKAVTFSLGKIFTLLFMTLGPLKILAPFANMTRGHDDAFRRRLAFRATIIALIATVIAPTVGANVLRNWGVSLGALLLTAGIVLFLVALKPVLEQYESQEPDRASPGSAASAAPPPSPMGLAFPTIVTPYGIAILIVLVSVRGSGTSVLQLLGVAAGVLLLDFVAMVFAHRILKTPFVRTGLGILGAVIGVLQVALGVQAAAMAVRLLTFNSP